MTNQLFQSTHKPIYYCALILLVSMGFMKGVQAQTVYGAGASTSGAPGSSAFGENASAYGALSTAIGASSYVTGASSTANGYNSHATGISSSALGKDSQAIGEVWGLTAQIGQKQSISHQKFFTNS